MLLLKLFPFAGMSMEELEALLRGMVIGDDVRAGSGRSSGEAGGCVGIGTDVGA